MTTMRGLRLTLVGPLPPPAGGMANQTHQLAELLGDAGAEVRVVQSNAPYWPAWVSRIPVVRAVFRLVPYLVRLWLACGRSQLVHVMANSGWSWHLFAAPAIRIASWRGVPVVVNYRGGEAATFLQQSIRRVRPALALAAVIAVPSGFLRKVFGDHGIATEVVPNVVDLDRFRPLAGRRAAAAHLVVTRNLEAIYDNATAIRALERVRRTRHEARLTIAGTGPEEQALRALAHELGVADAVHFAGRMDRDAVAALYRDADIALNPSTVDNTPNSVLEALASGIPVVSTDVGGVPYLLENGKTALLVRPRDPEAMADAVLHLLNHPTEATRISTAGLASVGQYTWSQVCPVLTDVYTRAMLLPASRRATTL